MKDLLAFPPECKDEAGQAMNAAQERVNHPAAKVMSHFGNANVREVVCDCDGDTYRVVFTVEFEKALYLLHAFQKKSKKGSITPKPDLDLVKKRLKVAQDSYEKEFGV
jgi:phage-related protein